MFKARIIGPEEALAVFGVVRLCYPDIEMRAWRDHLARLARSRSKGDAGCLVVQDWRQCTHACCLFRVVPDPVASRRLDVSYVAKADLPAGGAVPALFAAIEALAEERDCGLVVIQDFNARAFPEDRVLGVSPAAALADHGFAPAPTGYIKHIVPFSPAATASGGL